MAASYSIRIACFAVLLITAPAAASVRVTGLWAPLEPRTDGGFEIGPTFSLSTPIGPARDGFDASPSVGLVATWMESAYFGGGFDLGYSRWPSPGGGAVLDEIFTIFGRGTVRGTEVTWSALRVGGHTRFVPLPHRRITPWLEGGLGMNRLTDRFEIPPGQLILAGWSGKASGQSIDYAPDVTGSIGLDVRTSAHVRLGFEAAWRWMLVDLSKDGFTTFSLGGRLQFERGAR